MLPTTVTAVPALPLTPNGKLDRDRLPAPAPTRPVPVPAPAGDLVPAPAGDLVTTPIGDLVPAPAGDLVTTPTGDLVTTLAGVWAEILGVPVGPDDNFFELGGNSLYAIRVGTALRERGLPALPMRLLYTTPTARALAEALGHA
jgi:hypothetical protein